MRCCKFRLNIIQAEIVFTLIFGDVLGLKNFNSMR